MGKIKKYLFIIIAITFTSCLKDEQVKLPYNGYEPKIDKGGWEISSPQAEDMDAEALNQTYQLLYDNDRFVMARSLLIFRNGKLVAEAYPHDVTDIDNINNIQSCTKAVTSILTGIAIKNKLVGSLDEKFYSVYPELFDTDTSKRDICWRDALTMQTGLNFDNSEHTLELYRTSMNSAAYVLSLKRLYKSGLVMSYNDGAPQLVAKALEKKCGKQLSQFAREQLFSKLDITNWKWETAKDETNFGAFSLYLRPRDLGKIGQLLLQNGYWNGEQLIDSIYLKEATSSLVCANNNNEPFGYYFWILPAWNAYYALGHGGQFVLVVPDKQLVVVYTACPYISDKLYDVKNLLITYILESCNQ